MLDSHMQKVNRKSIVFWAGLTLVSGSIGVTTGFMLASVAAMIFLSITLLEILWPAPVR